MLDHILDLVKDQAMRVISGNSDVPAEKKDAAVETTTSAILDGLKSNITPDNISVVTNLLGLTSNNNASNKIVDSIQGSVISSLIEKVGLSKSVANTIATTVVPALMSLLSKKNADKNDSFDIGSLIKSVTGGDDSKKSGGGLLDALGGLFGGK